ncbi:MAG: alpha-1,2-fucosyltransferase [Burkholderiales bacterium]|nr:alpha-1,2-fucosyltransferase [Bacteroidia bacterium]
MIIVKLIGGLGNQMFQYAAARHLAFLHKTGLFVDTSYLDKNPNGAYTKRNLELNVFNVDLKIASPSDIKRFNIDSSNKYWRGIQRNFSFLFSNLYVAESGIIYNTQFSNFPKNTYLDGFWQSERYFKPIESSLLKEFTPKDKLDSENEIWLNKINSCESVSLHIRRGDYVSSENSQKHHGNLEISYYMNALKSIKEKHSKIEVFVFSDDLEWCRSNLKLDDTIHFVDANQKNNFHFDMYLMSHCKHNIIANSSFSWWGAWLNQNNTKIVIAPANWFADKTLNTKDLIPPSWIIV